MEKKIEGLVVIGSGFSIWETYTDEQLKEKLEMMHNDYEYLTDAIGKAETELFYRANPECRITLKAKKQKL